MAELVTLSEDGPLGKAGDQVWVDDPKHAEKPHKAVVHKTVRKPEKS